MSFSRRGFLGAPAVAAAAAALDSEASSGDGPASSGFAPVRLQGNTTFERLQAAGVSAAMAKAASRAPRGRLTSWGIPIQIEQPILLRKDGGAVIEKANIRAQWLVFVHTSDSEPLDADAHGFIQPMHGEGYLAQRVADYIVQYADGSESRTAIYLRWEANSGDETGFEVERLATESRRFHRRRRARHERRTSWAIEAEPPAHFPPTRLAVTSR